MRPFIFSIIFILFTSCGSRQDKKLPIVEQSTVSSAYPEESDDESDVEFPDGTYCAYVEYYNPNTGSSNTYQLSVEVEEGLLTTIHWPNGGWLDESHFSAEDISLGVCSFESDKGYEYTVTLRDRGRCISTDDRRMSEEIKEDIKSVTCPKCGDEKETWDELCRRCERKVKQTCPNCGGYKFSMDEVCDDCDRKEDHEF